MMPFSIFIQIFALILILNLLSCTKSVKIHRNAESENSATASVTKSRVSYSVMYKWKTFDFNFPSKDIRTEMIENGDYVPLNNILTGMKLHFSSNRLFLALPRIRPGVPSTLNFIQYNHWSSVKSMSPRLTPYPNWKSQKLGNCKAFQMVMSLEIDTYDRMWVIDNGRVINPGNTDIPPCPPKLVIIDLNTDKVIKSHEFPENVASASEAYLNDLVVACTSRDSCHAYITNSYQNLLTVYNLKEDRSWSLKHSSMVPDPEANNVTILGLMF